MHDLRLIHTDLKPENILLVSPDYIKVPDYKVKIGRCGQLGTILCLVPHLQWWMVNVFFHYYLKFSSRSPTDSSYYKRVPKFSAIKVIDFGSTIYDRQDQKYIVSTRHYRAPEVILGKNILAS